MEAATMSRSQAVPASVAKMQAKAAQLAAELQLAREGSDARGTSRSDNTDALSPTAAAASSARPQNIAATRRISQANATAKPATFDAQSVLIQCQKLEAQSQMWHNKHLESERELQRHQESYLRREQQLLARLADVDERLRQQSGQAMSDSTAGDADDIDGEYDSSSPGSPGQHRPSTHEAPTKNQPLTLEAVQDQMQRGVEDLLQHQRLQLHAEEAAQLRQFRVRLAEVEAQLAADKRAAAADQDSWMSKTLAVREELARTQEIAVKLDAMYRLAEDEAARLRVQFKAQEDDRQHLIRQVLGLKRQNHQLQQQSAALQEELDAIMALESEEGHGATAMHLVTSHQQPLHPGGMPQSAGPALLKPRPMTAGPTRSIQQQDVAHWRPLSGSPKRRPGSSSADAHAGDAGPEGGVQQQASASSQRVIQQLQKALQCERRQLMQLRAAHTAELGRRNELQTLLLDSIQQAKQQYQQAEAAHAAQCRAGCAAPAQQQQQQGLGISGASRPSSKMQARQQRPASAAVLCGARQQQTFAVHEAGPAGAAAAAVGGAAEPLGACEAAAASPAGAAAEGGYLDQQAWGCLLQDLLSRQQVLELLLQRSCPDLVAAARQLQQGRHVHADATEQLPRQPLQLDQLQEQQESDCQWAVSSSLLTQPQQQQADQGKGLHQHEQQPGCTTTLECCEGDMFIIQEDEGCSQVYSEGREGASGRQQEATVELTQQGGRSEQISHKQGSAGQLDQQEARGHLQDAEASRQEQFPDADQQVQLNQIARVLQSQPPQQQGRAHAGATPPGPGFSEAAQHHGGGQHKWGSPPHSWQRSPPAGSPPHVPHVQRCAPAGTAVTLGSMSGPLLGSFPVRKLLHSSSSGSSSHQHSATSSRVSGSTSPHNRGPARRPESAAAAASRPLGSAAVPSAFTLRPGSAVLPQAAVGIAPVSPSRTQNSPWQQHQQRQQQQQPRRQLSPQQQQQHHKQQQSSSSGQQGLSIRSWGSPDGRAAQQMLKSFLSGQ